MVFSWILFGTPLDPQSIGAGLLVGCGVALYARKPRPSAYQPVPTTAKSEGV